MGTGSRHWHCALIHYSKFAALSSNRFAHYQVRNDFNIGVVVAFDRAVDGELAPVVDGVDVGPASNKPPGQR